jgi:hypothetical protein
MKRQKPVKIFNNIELSEVPIRLIKKCSNQNCILMATYYFIFENDMKFLCTECIKKFTWSLTEQKKNKAFCNTQKKLKTNEV